MWSDEEIREEFPGFEGNIEHLRKLLEGVEVWNEWRAETEVTGIDLMGLDLRLRPSKAAEGALWASRAWGHGKEKYFVNLTGAHLEGASLTAAHLEGATLWGADLQRASLGAAHLEGADLMGAQLVHADLMDAHLRGADLTGTRLEGAKLDRADLEEARLLGANLEKARLIAASLEGARLRKAHLEAAVLREANLEGADLSNADLEGADLSKADLKEATWTEANLSRADLRVKTPENLRLDDTRILNSRFARRSADPWSVVRRAYSGPVLLFHLVFLLAFLAPYLARAGYWKGVNATQSVAAVVLEATDEQIKKSAAKLEGLAEDPRLRDELKAEWQQAGHEADRGLEILESAAIRQRERLIATAGLRVLGPVQKLGLCMRPTAECAPPQPVWRPLLGLHQEKAPVVLQLLALALIIYNICRGALTYYVSGLRDAEIRGGYSPRLREYIGVYYLHHYFLWYVPIAGLTAAAFQIAEWLLFTDVVLPAV